MQIIAYRIAENFRGWKRSRISWFESHPRKFSDMHEILGVSYPPMIGLVFHEIKFSPQNVHFLPICKSFLSQKFPAIRYPMYCNLNLVYRILKDNAC